MITNKPFKKRICYFLRRITGRETYKEEFLRKNKIKTEEDLYRYIQNVKVNIKMLKNRNIKMYRAPIFIPPAVLPKRIVFL